MITIHSQKVFFAIFTALLLSIAVCPQVPPIEPGVSRELAQWRASQYSDIRYKLSLTLEKMSPVLKGTIEIRVNVSPLPKGTHFGDGLRSSPVARGSIPPIVLDWRKIPGHEKDSTISNVMVNGVKVQNIPDDQFIWRTILTYFVDKNDHLVFRDGVEFGENVIKLDFSSPILASGSAITRYVDKEDGSEYLYSMLVPSDVSRAFPVFDQPDLKARFTVGFLSPPEDWKIITNTPGFCIDGAEPYGIVCSYQETQSISTHLFAFAAGPWAEFDETGGAGGNLSGSEGVPSSVATPQRDNAQRDTLPTGRVSASDPRISNRTYVRKSQAEKFKGLAPEVSRLNREWVRYLQQNFDYTPPKHDVILVPELVFPRLDCEGLTFQREPSRK